MNRETDIPTMLKKLDELFEREDSMKRQYAQLQADKKLLMAMIEHKQDSRKQE